MAVREENQDVHEGYVIDGQQVSLPVEVRSAHMVAAQYFVDADAAQRLIDYSGLRIARQAGSRAMCALSAVSYIDNDLGDYDEFAVAFIVEPHDAPPGTKPSFSKPTTFIHRLPVNQEFTCKAGRGIWGFPKWVTDISYVERPRSTSCVIIEDGEFVLGLEVRNGWVPLPSKPIEMNAYSCADGVLNCTPWTTTNTGARMRVGGAVLSLGSTHPMSTELRDLGLPKRALLSTSTRQMSATFGAARKIEG